jgi:hypothetical protein
MARQRRHHLVVVVVVVVDVVFVVVAEHREWTENVRCTWNDQHEESALRWHDVG